MEWVEEKVDGGVASINYTVYFDNDKICITCGTLSEASPPSKKPSRLTLWKKPKKKRPSVLREVLTQLSLITKDCYIKLKQKSKIKALRIFRGVFYYAWQIFVSRETAWQ